MSVKDTGAKDFLADSRRFADLCNYYLFDGRHVLDADDLQPQDSTELISAVNATSKALANAGNALGITDKSLSTQKWRDILKKAVIKRTDSRIYIIIGIENQTDIHYAMPVRNMLYDALNYSRQTNESAKQHYHDKDYSNSGEFLSGFKKTDRLTPVITLTVYWGSDAWDAPRSLHDMMNTEDKELLNFVSDYRLNLIVPNEITDFGKFRTSLGLVLEAIKCSSDEAAMGQLFNSNPLFKALDIETANAINTFTHLNLHFNKKEATTNMCKAWDDHRLSGKIEGKIEGSTLKLIDQTIKKVKKGCSAEQIADMLEESIETIQPIYDIIVSMKSEYDAEKVYELLNRTPVPA